MGDECRAISANLTPFFYTNSCGMLSHVTCSALLWSLCNEEKENIPSVSHRQSSIQFQSVGANWEWVTMQKTKPEPNRDFLVNISVCKSSSNSLGTLSSCQHVCVWAQPGNFLLRESLVVQWTHPHTVEVVVMRMSDISFIAAFDWHESFRNDARNFPWVHIWIWCEQITAADSIWTVLAW